MSRPALVVGTAGHIDHGKSRLVRALTGTDPDRLPEEQARGMTIDLGFAHSEVDGCDIYFVDVPGHERFIRNMLVGAAGIDTAMLVVAADDSVMPQTREHAEVLRLLGIQRCIVALSKMDLVDEPWADEVAGEVHALLTRLGIEPIRVVKTSAVNGQGLDALRETFASLARERVVRQDEAHWFCMPVDRSFTVPGRGTVVTGTVRHGMVARDAELELWPPGDLVRVRDLETHGDARERTEGRLRLALNLASVERSAAARGSVLATPGYLSASRIADAHLPWLRLPGKSRRHRLRLRLHIDAMETLVEVRLSEQPERSEVADVFAQLAASEPLVCAHGTRFIVRDESATRTLGGGVILAPVARPWTARHPADLATLRALLSADALERLEAAVQRDGWGCSSPRALAARSSLADEPAVVQAAGRLQGAGRVRTFDLPSGRALVHSSLISKFVSQLQERFERYAAAHPRAPGFPRSELGTWMPASAPERLRTALGDWLFQQGVLQAAGEYVRAGRGSASLPSADAALMTTLLGEFEAAAFQPPGLEALACRTPKNEKRLRELIALAVAEGRLVRIADGLWLHGQHWESLGRQVCAAIRARGPLTVSDIRVLIGSTRKYVVPICERLDAAGITRRLGDARSLGPKAPPEPPSAGAPPA